MIPRWTFNKTAKRWELPPIGDVSIVLVGDDDGWKVILSAEGRTEFLGFAVGGFTAHRALGRVLWRRLATQGDR